MLEPPLPALPTLTKSSYFICSVQRSGTWLLSGLLASTGAAGRPHEYFEPVTEHANKLRWGVDSFADYLGRVLEAGTTDNGVFGTALMWANLMQLLARLRKTSGGGAETDTALIELFFPAPRYVLLSREDVAAQAVSWAKAIQTGYYHHWDPAVGEPRFDFDQIDTLVREISEHSESWRRWFAENEIEPLAIRFEDLVEGKERVTRDLLAFLGVDLPADAVVSELTTKAADEVNEEWLGLYRARKGSRA